MNKHKISLVTFSYDIEKELVIEKNVNNDVLPKADITRGEEKISPCALNCERGQMYL